MEGGSPGEKPEDSAGMLIQGLSVRESAGAAPASSHTVSSVTAFGLIPGLRVTSCLVTGAPESVQSVARVLGCCEHFSEGAVAAWGFLNAVHLLPSLLEELSGGQGPCSIGAATLIIDE